MLPALPAAGLGAAVVLAGGRATRLGGVDKGQLRMSGESLLGHALAATADARSTVVVGTRVPTSRPVVFTRESPPLGGPAAGLLAGLDLLVGRGDLVVGDPADDTWVAVLAVDMPSVTRATVQRLLAAAPAADGDGDGAVLRGQDGRRQLAAVVRCSRLVDADPGADRRHGLPIHRLLGGLHLTEVAAVGDEAEDVDTWPDLRRSRAEVPVDAEAVVVEPRVSCESTGPSRLRGAPAS